MPDTGAGEVASVGAGVDPEWEHQLREMTEGRGVDIVFDGVGGAIGQAAFDVVARGGRSMPTADPE